MITSYKIFESKQVGVLYHWTYLNRLKWILEQDTMKSPRYDYISFSRNKNLSKMDDWYGTVMIKFDGDKMSNKWKFEPHLYKGDMGELKFKKEAEERIKCNSNNSIKGIKKYILEIIINKTFILTKEDYVRETDELIEKIRVLAPNIKINII